MRWGGLWGTLGQGYHCDQLELLRKKGTDGYLCPHSLKKNIYKPPMLNGTTTIDASRRVLSCRDDLRYIDGKKPKAERSLHPSVIGRKLKPIFTKGGYINNYPVLIPADSMFAGRNNKLGLVA